MADTITLDTVTEVLNRLARFEPSAWPVVSLYLNLQADKHGKANYASFLKKELLALARTYPPRSEARESFDRDVVRIEQYVSGEVAPSTNGVAIFACAGRDSFFEALPFDAPIDSHRLSVSDVPHLYPLEQLLDQYPRHAVVLADSHAARLFVFGLGRTIAKETVEGEKINHSSVGGWSQMRYQRHVGNILAEHARELVKALERVVREEKLEHIVLAGDEVNVRLIKDELPADLAHKVIEVLKLEVRTAEQDVMSAAAEALRRHDAKTDIEGVERVFGDYRAGGLAVVGREETLTALMNGQVDELFLTAGPGSETEDSEITADELVARARQTSARVRFIEDPELLAGVDGVAAALRYRQDGVAGR